MAPPRPIRILLLEDRDDDAILEERELRKAGMEFELKRTADRPSFIEALREFKPELILSDHTLMGFTGIEALEIASEMATDTPFIFVSGTIGEEAAIEALRRGATDYVIKDRMGRLVPAVQRALREAMERRDHARLEQEFLQVQKMESLGRMAGSIAHDFNNLLLVVTGQADLLIRPGELSESARTRAEAIRTAAERGRELTAQLLAFSRAQPGEAVEFDLNARLKAFEPVIGSLIGRAITLTTTYGRGPLTLRGSSSQVDQVVMNLLVNARDAMPEGGAITLTTARLDAQAESPAGFPLLPPGAYALLTVADTGSGMPPDVQARAFEPFFTTKAVGQGTGLGLSTVYGIVKQFGGAVQVKSEPGQGCAFRLLFRLAGSASAAGAAARPVALVVDDDGGVRAYTRHLLEAAEWEVSEAAGGREALVAFETEPAAFALLLTDVMMPEVDGIAVARAVRAKRPDLPVVFMSGMAGALEQAGAAVPGATLIAKPFSPTELNRILQVVRGAAA